MSSSPPQTSARADGDEYESIQLRMGSVTMWLIAFNVVVFILEYYTPWGLWILNQGCFAVGPALFHLQLWRFITFQFLHAGLNHILFNMLALYVFGPLVETYLGSRRYAIFYLLSGIGGAVLYVILWRLGILREANRGYLVGASAGIFGVLIASARIAPDATVMLLFPPIPIKLKVLAWILIGIALATIFFKFGNAGGEAAHLGGAVVGIVLIRSRLFLSSFERSGKRER